MRKWQDFRDVLCDPGYPIEGEHEARQQDRWQEEKERHLHGLELGLGQGGDQQSESLVAALCFVHVMGGDQNSGTFIHQTEEGRPEITSTPGGHGAGGFVQEQQFRPMQGGGGEG